MRTYRIEVEYEYHPSTQPGGENPRLHWMYVAAKGKDLAEALAFAKKSYETRIRDLGWGKITTLREIRPPKRVNDPAPTKTTSTDSGTSGSKSSRSNSKSGQGAATGDRRKTRTSKRRVKKSKSA